VCAACLKYSVLIFVEKIYIKCNTWRVAVRPSYIWDARFLKVKRRYQLNLISFVLEFFTSKIYNGLGTIQNNFSFLLFVKSGDIRMFELNYVLFTYTRTWKP